MYFKEPFLKVYCMQLLYVLYVWLEDARNYIELLFLVRILKT